MAIRSITFIVAILLSATALAQPDAPGLREDPGIPASQMPAVLSQVAFDQRLNEQLPLGLEFRDETGRAVRLGEFFGTRPVVLAFVYYECPMLCNQVLNGLASSLTVLTETVGQEFDVVAVSFDPRETPIMATAKKKAYVDRYKRAGSDVGWHFLTGTQPSIAALTAAAGFKYTWDESTQQFAHASGIVVATPGGRLSRYFFGIEYAPRDVKFALIESSEGRIGNAIDRLVLYCYHYDPAKGEYGFVAMRAVRLGGALTVVALLGFIVVSLSREQRHQPGSIHLRSPGVSASYGGQGPQAPSTFAPEDDMRAMADRGDSPASSAFARGDDRRAPADKGGRRQAL